MMRLKRLTRCVVLALLALAALAAAEYHGQVKFAGLPLPGVTITATKGDKVLAAVTDQQGVFSFADLPDGSWSLQVDKPGFIPIGQDVTAGSSLPGPSFELKMLPLDEMQTVSPSAAPEQTTTIAPAPTVPAPAKPTTAKGKAADIPNTPQTAFQSTNLNATSANAPAPATEQSAPAPEVTNELAQRAADGFLINGSAINGRSTPFAQSPAFGNARRGGPRLYTYALALVDSNSALDAANFSLTGQHTPKPPFNNMTGTASFGGPIRIPHLLERNGPQFTVNYSRVENRASRVQTSLMPDAAQRTGDFSNALYAGKAVTIYDPDSGNPFPGNMIPASRISVQALSLLPYYPAPNFAGGAGYNYQVPLIANTHTDNLRASLQKAFKRKNNVSGLFGMSDTRSDSNSQFNFLDLTRSLGLNSMATWRRTYTPRFFGTFTYQFSRQSNQLIPFFAGRENVSGAAGITGNSQQPVNWGPPSLQFNQSTIAGLSDGTTSITHNQTSAISYASSWNHHSHNLSFGGDFRWQQFNTISQSNPRGTFTFSGAATAQIANGVPVPGTGFDFADFLLGTPDASAIAYGNADKYFRAQQPDLYVQDDWRVRSGLTLILGLRWEYTSPIGEKYGRLVNLDIASGFTAISPVVANGTIRPDHHEIQPRIGLAWRPFSASSMVVRAGYGISYNTQVYLPFANLMAQQSPLSTSLNVANTVADPLTLANGFYSPPNVTTNTVAVDPNFKVGYAQVWNLAVQRDLPGALQMVATYTGTKGTHQLQAFAPNTYPTGPVVPSGYVYYTSGGNSTREAGTLQLRRRLHNGLTATVQYTYSKSIDDAATLGGGSLGSVAQNWLDLSGERGLSTFDQRHLANITLQYTSGMGVGGGALLTGWWGRLIKDWTILDGINVGSGLPLTPIYSQLIPGTGIPGIVRADYTGAPLYDGPAGYFINPAAVTAPAQAQWGDAGRDSITGPGQFSMNASMARAFRLTDRFTLNLRFDTTNPLNHVVVTQVNTMITNPLFGLPQAVNAMRNVATTLRLTF
jgi:carboxypeptidase family protein